MLPLLRSFVVWWGTLLPNLVLKRLIKVSEPSFWFLDFPATIFVLFITSWLSFGEFARLDSALCNQHVRRKYLLVTSRQPTVFPECTGNLLNTEDVIRWLASKGVSVRKLFFNQILTYQGYKYPINFDHSHVRTLMIGRDCIDQHHTDAIEKFKDNLESLQFLTKRAFGGL